ADEPAELHQRVAGGEALEAHDRRRQAQRRQLLGGEPGVAQVVAVAWDAVAVDGGHDPGDGLDDDRHAHAPQGVLVTLERPPERVGVLGVVLPEPFVDLLRRHRPRRRQQEGRQVEQPFQLRRRHPARGYLAAADTCPTAAAAHAPAADAAAKNGGSSAGPRPMVVTASPSSSSTVAASGPSTTVAPTSSCASDGGSGSSGRTAASPRIVRTWWLTPR